MQPGNTSNPESVQQIQSVYYNIETYKTCRLNKNYIFLLVLKNYILIQNW